MTEDGYYAQLKLLGLRLHTRGERSDLYRTPDRQIVTVPHADKLAPEMRSPAIEVLKAKIGADFPNYRSRH